MSAETTTIWAVRYAQCRDRALGLCPDEETTMTTNETTTRPLTLNEAGHLADLIRAQERHDRLYWYPLGASGGAPNSSYVLRAFTHEGGGLWFDNDGDVRDAYVWCSGITELWLKVSDIIRALENVIDVRHGEDQPMARIEER